jgi:hypothetical protein
MVCATLLKTPFIAKPNLPSHSRCRERRTHEHIAVEIGISKASVSRILKRRGLIRNRQLNGVAVGLPAPSLLAFLRLVTDHGLTLCSTDGDFARFPDLRWLNPIA